MKAGNSQLTPFFCVQVNHKRQNEVIPYNDCLYRNLYQYEYIALLDIDEVIMPTKGSSWKELMVAVDAKARQSRNDSRASYNFRNIYFMDDMMHGHDWFQGIPRYMHMLQVKIIIIYNLMKS